MSGSILHTSNTTMGDMNSIEDISSTKQRRNTTLLLAVIAVAIVGGFTIGILIGRFATCPDEENAKYKKSVQEADSAITDLLLQSVSAENIEVNLKHLTQSPHIAGRDRDFELVAYLKSKFTEYGLDSVKSKPYQVLLSYPDNENPNTVLIVNNTGGETIVFDSTSTESNVSQLEGVIRPFLAYSPSGVVNTSKLVYVNYGRVEDFEFLRTNYNMTFNDSIVIVRYGKNFRGSKVEIAARYGALGVIIYSDPVDYAWSGDPRYFPETWFLPSSGAQRGSLYTGVGDPLTPGYPSIATAYRYNESSTPTPLPTIPAHAMGYGGAIHFLKVRNFGSGSDYSTLLQFVGITSVDISYMYDPNKYPIAFYPLYHTEYETFDAVKRLIDPDFRFHRSVGQVAVEIVRSLADSLIIPFNVSDYAWGLEMNRQTLDKGFGSRLQQIVSNYPDLQKVIEGFKKDVHEFERTVSQIDRKDPMAIRMINDQLLFLEKAFLDSEGLPSRPQKKHLIFAESINDAYAGNSFPGLVDLLFDIDKLQADRLAERLKEIQHHFSVLLNAIQAAGYTLRDVVKFVEETY